MSRKQTWENELRASRKSDQFKRMHRRKNKEYGFERIQIGKRECSLRKRKPLFKRGVVLTKQTVVTKLSGVLVWNFPYLIDFIDSSVCT